jgi:hypothetical protein
VRFAEWLVRAVKRHPTFLRLGAFFLQLAPDGRAVKVRGRITSLEVEERAALVKAKLVHHGGVLFASAGFLMTTNEATTNSRVLASS